MKKTVALALFSSLMATAFGQSLYDVSSITLVELEFPVSNWDELMDEYYAADLDQRLVGTCTINGQFYDSVGVTYKGNSTYSATSLKNPLNIQLDYAINQTFQGYSTLKLSNGSKDPSFVREVLSYEIGREYMDLPLSNYAKVMINGSYYGLFSSSESVDGDYQERRLFADNDNTRFKCNPVSVFDGGSSLEYLGSDSSDYFDFYELKSDLGWNDLVDFTFNLETNIAEIEAHLDVDRTLWMLAFNTVLVNLDSYSGPFKQNYYLIKDDEGRFLPIIWDLNQSFGSFAMIGGGGPPDLTDLTEMDLFLNEDDPTFPLIYQLMSVPRYRKMYLAHVKTMVEEQFSDDSYYTRAEEIQDIILAEVEAEPNGFYTTVQFTSNLYETEGGGGGPGPGGIFGISEVMEPRIDYLTGLPEWDYVAPSISAVNASPALPTAYATVTITAEIEDATYVYVGYRNDWGEAFEKVEMFDDGLHGDGAAGDLVYGASIALAAKDIHYYIYADNAQAGKFAPVRAEHEFYNLIIGSDVVINELMPQNEVTITDEMGDYEDWIELYNTTATDIDLSGYYLSDRPNSMPLMWEIPDGTIIPGNGYLTIWLDEDTLDAGLHANFKLSTTGESISFSDADGFEISRVKMPEMSASTTYGRYPNGDGPFMRMFPTYAAENSFTALSIETDQEIMEVLIYPNPTNDLVTFQLSNETPQLVHIYSLTGQLMYSDTMVTTAQISVNEWESGVYLVVFPEFGVTQKLVKN